jgi:hypothetical protein
VSSTQKLHKKPYRNRIPCRCPFTLVSRIAATLRTLLGDILRCPQVAVGEGLLNKPVLLSLLPLLLYSALYNISEATTIGKKIPFALIGIGFVIKVKPLPATQREKNQRHRKVFIIAVSAVRIWGVEQIIMTTKMRWYGSGSASSNLYL